MNAIECKKIGVERYTSGILVDKNSAYNEYIVISNACKEACEIYDGDGKAFVVIGGLWIDDIEKIETEVRVIDLKSQGYKIVYILTDFTVIESNKEVIDSSDLILHLGLNVPDDYFGKGLKHTYGYIPELSIFNEAGQPRNYIEKVFVCGSILSKEERYAKYGLYNDWAIEAKTKYGDGKDERIEYNEYLELCKRYMFTFVCNKEIHSNIGWTTTRYLESLCLWQVPFIDDEFTVLPYLRSNKYLESLRTRDAEHLRENVIVHSIARNDDIRMMKFARDEMFKYKRAFHKVLSDFVDDGTIIAQGGLSYEDIK